MLSFEIYFKSTILVIPLGAQGITSKISPCNSDGVTAQELAYSRFMLLLPPVLSNGIF